MRKYLSVSLSRLNQRTDFNEVYHGYSLMPEVGHRLLSIPITDVYAGEPANKRKIYLVSSKITLVTSVTKIGQYYILGLTVLSSYINVQLIQHEEAMHA